MSHLNSYGKYDYIYDRTTQWTRQRFRLDHVAHVLEYLTEPSNDARPKVYNYAVLAAELMNHRLQINVEKYALARLQAGVQDCLVLPHYSQFRVVQKLQFTRRITYLTLSLVNDPTECSRI